MRLTFARLETSARPNKLLGYGWAVDRAKPELRSKGPHWFSERRPISLALWGDNKSQEAQERAQEFKELCSAFMRAFSHRYRTQVDCQDHLDRLAQVATDEEARVEFLLETIDKYLGYLPVEERQALRTCYIVGKQFDFITPKWLSTAYVPGKSLKQE